MNKTAELRVLIKASYRVCKVLNIDTNTHILFGTQSISARLKSKPDGNEGSEIVPVSHHKKILTEFLRFYRALHGFSGGDVAYMNHWLNVKNKRFGVLPRELFLTCEGIQRLNQYFEDLHISNHQPKE